MDTCHHHFLIALCSQSLYFLSHIFHGTARQRPSHMWDNTVCAILVAAILYFQIRAGVPRPVRLLAESKSSACRLQTFVQCLHGLFDFADNVRLICIGQEQIHRPVHFISGFGRVHVTAGRHHQSLWIQFSGTVQHLSGFAVRHIGYRAGIDHIDIRNLSE